MFSPIFISQFFSQFDHLYNKTKKCIGTKQFFLSLPVEKEIITIMYLLKKIVDLEYEIGKTIL